MKKDSLFYTVVFSFSITFVLVFILSLADSYTKERVEKIQSLAIAKAYLLVSGVEVADESDTEKLFKETFNIDTPGSDPLTAKIGNTTVIVSPFSGKGLWGTITGVIAVDSDFTRIVGIEITSHSETPGLGGRIEEEWFKEQFKGESIANEIKVVQSGGMGDTDPDNGILDGITGATRTSESMQNIINNQIRILKSKVNVADLLSEDETLKRSFLAAGGIYSESEKEIDETFNTLFKGEKISQSYITGRLEERKVVAAPFMAKGYSGCINGVLLLDSEAGEIIGVEIISHSEKQGAAIDDMWFKEQFRGVDISKGFIIVPKDVDIPSSKAVVLDGISGATTTNQAMESGINQAINVLKKEGVNL